MSIGFSVQDQVVVTTGGFRQLARRGAGTFDLGGAAAIAVPVPEMGSAKKHVKPEYYDVPHDGSVC